MGTWGGDVGGGRQGLGWWSVNAGKGKFRACGGMLWGWKKTLHLSAEEQQLHVAMQLGTVGQLGMFSTWGVFYT